MHRAATAMSGVAIPGRSLMSMNACLMFFSAVSRVADYVLGLSLCVSVCNQFCKKDIS